MKKYECFEDMYKERIEFMCCLGYLKGAEDHVLYKLLYDRMTGTGNMGSQKESPV